MRAGAAVRVWILALAPVLACVAQTATTTVPPEPSWDWIVHYAAQRLRSDTVGWAASIRAIPADGNNLTPGQLQILRQTTDATLATITHLQGELSQPFDLDSCPAVLDHAVTEFQAAANQLARDAVPPWTVHDHRTLFAPMPTLLFGFRSELGCFPNPPPATPLPHSGPYSIHGKVLDAAGKPLAKASIVATLPGMAPHFTAGEDGGWALTGLPSGCFLVSALSPGYFEASQFIGAGVNAASICANQAPQASAMGAAIATPAPGGAIVFRLRPSGVADVPYGPLVAAYPLEQIDLPLNAGRLSPGGHHLALIIGNDVWLYNLANHSLIESGKLPESYWDARYQMGWVGTELLIADLESNGFKGYLQADTSGLRPATLSSAAIQSAFAPEPLHPISINGVAGDYTVTTQNLGHGNVHLFVQHGSAAPRSIAAGNWELPTTMINAKTGRVYYPTFPNPGIVTYDLATGASHLTPLPNRAQKLLDAVRIPGGVLIAYSTYGACGGAAGISRERATRYCLMKIPDGPTR